jgi:uncharacterized membrane protein (TIGR02234 family)
VAGAVVLTSIGRDWATVQAGGSGEPLVLATLTGRQLLPVVAGAGVLMLAGVAGVAATRSFGRVCCALLVALAGLVAIGSAGRFGWTAAAAATAAGAAELGVAPTAASTNWWWLVTAFGGLLAVVAGAITARRGSRWPAMGSRYERESASGTSGASASPSRSRTPAQAWDALDRGVDPTIDSDLTQ